MEMIIIQPPVIVLFAGSATVVNLHIFVDSSECRRIELNIPFLTEVISGIVIMSRVETYNCSRRHGENQYSQGREIEIGAIITSLDADLTVDTQVVEVSEKFVNLLCGFEKARYITVKINLDGIMDVARTEEEIEGYFETLEQVGANFIDASSAVKNFAEMSLFEGTQYLFVLTAVWLVYMLMMYHGNQAY